MVFPSTVFLFLFLPITLLIYYSPCSRKRNFRNLFLVCMSLLFYAWGEPVFVFNLILSIVVTYLFVRIMIKGHAKRWLIFCVAYHIVNIFIFKYLTFVCAELGILIGNKEVNIALPIGISFFTFQLLSYIFDVYYGKVKVQENILHLALYVSLFPQLIAGPIVRYETIEREIEERKESLRDVLEGSKRFAIGLGKKVLLANYLAVISDTVFSLPSRSVLIVWLGAISYTLQIYFDFSGYSDMAIGLGRMFGFHFLENFNYPYISKSVTEFWRRWHISLSSWFKDYVYIPLGGNRVTHIKWIRNLFLVWLLTGIWHGANWTFIVWGLLYFVVLLLEKEFCYPQRLGFFNRVYTLFVVIIAWVIFRSESMSMAIKYIGEMFGVGTVPFGSSAEEIIVNSGWLIIGVASLACVPVYQKLIDIEAVKIKRIVDLLTTIWAVVILILSLASIINGMYNPFIYFNF